MVHAQAADAVAGGGYCSDPAVVDTGRSPSGAVLVDDWEIPGAAGAAGVGSGVGGAGSAVRRCGVTGFFARARERTERRQLWVVAAGADDGDVRLGGYSVQAVPTPE